MKRIAKSAFLAVASLLPLAACADAPPSRTVVADIGLSTPESVEYYPAEDVYLVANINGDPMAADGNGFISKLKPDGSVIALKWIDGSQPGTTLSAPKGTAVVGNHLFVADIDRVEVFDLPSGKQAASIAIPGSTFLNGLTPAEGDCAYVTDSGFGAGFAPSGTDAIYRVCGDGKIDTIAKDADLGRPNGILVDDGKLIVVLFGSAGILAFDTHGKFMPLPAAPKGSLDGIVKSSDGRLLVSSWDGSAVYALGKDGKFTEFAGSLDAPADMGYDSKRHRVLVPLFKRNEIAILQEP